MGEWGKHELRTWARDESKTKIRGRREAILRHWEKVGYGPFWHGRQEENKN
jgi:hypothetical protein